MNPRVEHLRALLARGLYRPDERLIADAIIAHARARGWLSDDDDR